MAASILTTRGQVSVPAGLRKAMKLHPGQRLQWERISDREIRVVVEASAAAGPMSVLGYARKFRKEPRRTSALMKELREGESASAA